MMDTASPSRTARYIWSPRRSNSATREFHHRLLAKMVILFVCVSAICGAQTESSGAETTELETPSSSPHDAFQAGQFAQAAESFAIRAERKPKDAATQINLGSALHQLEDYDGARSAFERALAGQDRRLRAKATYDLGNTAYRQGRLEEAIDRYRETLELDAEDEDAKYNLEFVQLEQKRRQEQAKQRQEQQGEQEDSNKDKKRSEDGQDGEGASDSSQDSEGNQSEPEKEPAGQQGEPKDTDGDGLSDQQEREAENPTDPQTADTDRDGRSDGEEDKNKNGKVDPGESDPNQADQAPEQSAGSESQQDASQDQAGQPSALNPGDVERLLAALEDRRPPSSRGKEPAGKRAKRAKDW